MLEAVPEPQHHSATALTHISRMVLQFKSFVHKILYFQQRDVGHCDGDEKSGRVDEGEVGGGGMGLAHFFLITSMRFSSDGHCLRRITIRSWE
jgi:hypothetical protein